MTNQEYCRKMDELIHKCRVIIARIARERFADESTRDVYEDRDGRQYSTCVLPLCLADEPIIVEAEK